MPRAPRIEYDGAVYHVMSRGDRREAIFVNDDDRRLFLKTLVDACGKTGWVVYAFVLMSNHYHLLLETPNANLVAGMKWLQSTYTQRFNRRHRLVGPLFQGRYKALLVDGREDGYFRTLSDYIHLNPARAKLIRLGEQPLADYPWSSYPLYLKPAQDRPVWLQTGNVLWDSGGEKDDAAGRGRYRDYVEARALELLSGPGSGAQEQVWKGLRRGWCMGGKVFREAALERVAERMAGKQEGSYDGAAKREHDEREAERLLMKALEKVGLTAAELDNTAKGLLEKALIAWLLHQRTTVSLSWIASRLHMGHISRVSNAIARISQTEDERTRRLFNEMQIPQIIACLQKRQATGMSCQGDVMNAESDCCLSGFSSLVGWATRWEKPSIRIPRMPVMPIWPIRW
jgi:putative transposase